MLGHGYPVFNYYTPLAYYVIGLWRLLGASYYLAYAIASGLLILVAGCGMYLLARAVFGPYGQGAALVAAAAYMFAPSFSDQCLRPRSAARGAGPGAAALGVWGAHGPDLQRAPLASCAAGISCFGRTGVGS